MCTVGHLKRQVGTEAEVGVLNVRLGRQRLHQPAGNAGNCHGELVLRDGIHTSI